MLNVEHVGIVRAFCLFVCFSMPEGTEKIAGLWFARGGIRTQADTMGYLKIKC